MTSAPPDVMEPSAAAPPPKASERPSRWWIAAVPVAIVAMFAASGYRVSTFWYESGLHREIASAEPGQWAEASESYLDAQGEGNRIYSVRFAGLGGTDTAYEDRSGDEITLPSGMVARTVNLDFRAEPDQPLKSCAVSLIDDEGREYRVGHLSDAIGLATFNCVPEDTPGPDFAVLESQVRGAIPPDEQPRPREWSTSPRIAVPEDATFVELRISYGPPNYVKLTLPR